MNTAGLALYFGMRFAKRISMEIANFKVKERFIPTASNIRKLKLNFQDSGVPSRNMQMCMCFLRKFVVSLVFNLLKEQRCACLQSFHFIFSCGYSAPLKRLRILLGYKWLKRALLRDHKCNCDFTPVCDVM